MVENAVKLHVLVRGLLVVQTWILEHDAEALACFLCCTSGLKPSSRIVPAVGRNRVVSILIVVVFPAPFGPRKAKISPC